MHMYNLGKFTAMYIIDQKQWLIESALKNDVAKSEM
jgi:hypothetical protein